MGLANNNYNFYGRSKIGTPVYSYHKGKKSKRLNFIGFSDNNHKFLDLKRYDCNINSKIMEEYLYQINKIRNNKKTYLILDNAKIHKTKSFIETAKKLNIELLFLPPYSPFLNKIEDLI